MGSNFTGSLIPSTDDLIPTGHARRTIKALGKDMKGPQMPGATAAEKALEGRQREELAKLDDEENTRIKRGLRGQLGSRRLLSSVRSVASKAAGAASTTGGAAPNVRLPRVPKNARSTV